MKRLPNLVLILSDDQGAWALGCAANSEIQTPNLDRLAATGTRFSRFFCASPVCSPARASLLTGHIPSRHGIHDWLRKGNMDEQGDHAIPYLLGLRGYTQLLARAGYVCALSGKWHLGDSLRAQQGFTHWFAHQLGGGPYYNAPLIRNGTPYREPRYVTDVITDDALEFLAEQRCREQPFYLSVHYTAPHSPWDPQQHPDDVLNLYADCPFLSCPDEPAHPWQINSAPRGTGEKRKEQLRGYYAAVTAMDRNVGRILDALEAMDRREETLILFTSDNGMNMGHHGIFGKGNGTFPQNMYDTSVMVPAIFSRPGSCPAGVVVDGLYSHYDVFPTLLEYAGIDFRDETLPGASFAPLLRGEGMPGREDVVVCDEYGPVRMIRNRRWKYVHRFPCGPHELYDLAEDPGERHNLFAEKGAQSEIERLKGRLDRFFLRYGDPGLDGAREPVYGVGQVGLAGIRAGGAPAFHSEFHYVDADGRPRPPGYRPEGLLPPPLAREG
ncbi:MAG: sulfatase-like hydrolase/transferase [Armatimonadota bacterium]|nr:sulfatase-like hydrolase/transferase [Armatimonadota bacterium]